MLQGVACENAHVQVHLCAFMSICVYFCMYVCACVNMDTFEVIEVSSTRVEESSELVCAAAYAPRHPVMSPSLCTCIPAPINCILPYTPKRHTCTYQITFRVAGQKPFGTHRIDFHTRGSPAIQSPRYRACFYLYCKLHQ